jgi:2-hydroxy-3-keto-5-methylthiopentenyl-1-phosphate phosphatase
MALVTATPAEMNALLDDIQVDEGFTALLELCAAHLVPVHVVSDGFDYCINRILTRSSLNLAPYLRLMRIHSSHLEALGTRWRASFTSFERACAHGCATCKPAAMASMNKGGAPTIFAGDGLSDRYAAVSADLVFAKGRLAAHCSERAIRFRFYDNLTTLAAQLEELLSSDAMFRRALSGRVFPAR